MGELAIICIREKEGQGPAHPLGAYECAAAWWPDGWRWQPIRMLAGAEMVIDLVMAGYKIWRVKQRDALQMSCEDCIYWDELQGAGYVP